MPSTSDPAQYCHHSILAQPRGWAEIGRQAAQVEAALAAAGGALYGVWRSQIGRPRDETTLITRWPDGVTAATAEAALLGALPPVRRAATRLMRPTLRPATGAPPTRQGNYAFRHFSLPEGHLPEFLDLCVAAWPGFEAAYDSQVIGLWRLDGAPTGQAETLLLTRRPNLAMWERSKLPEGDAEADVRAKLSRRYDLCDDTDVFTTTLLTATDRADAARWT